MRQEQEKSDICSPLSSCASRSVRERTGVSRSTDEENETQEEELPFLRMQFGRGGTSTGTELPQTRPSLAVAFRCWHVPAGAGGGPLLA